MNIDPIKTEADCKAMLVEIEGLMMARANTPEGERLDVRVTLGKRMSASISRWRHQSDARER